MENHKEEYREYDEHDENAKVNNHFSHRFHQMKSAFDTYGLVLYPRVNTDKKQKYLRSQFYSFQKAAAPHYPAFQSGLLANHLAFDGINLMEAVGGRPKDEFDPALLRMLMKSSSVGMAKASHKICKDKGESPTIARPVSFYKCEKPGCARTYTTMARYTKHLQAHMAASAHKLNQAAAEPVNNNSVNPAEVQPNQGTTIFTSS
jgi:hypothetical protein